MPYLTVAVDRTPMRRWGISHAEVGDFAVGKRIPIYEGTREYYRYRLGRIDWEGSFHSEPELHSVLAIYILIHEQKGFFPKLCFAAYSKEVAHGIASNSVGMKVLRIPLSQAVSEDGFGRLLWDPVELDPEQYPL